MTDFRLNPDANVNHSHKISEVTLVPGRLVECFGPPRECDGYKVSGVYRFVDDVGRGYTVYDWKSTSLYNDRVLAGEECDLPTPQKFWSSEEPQEFSIGGRDGCDVPAFEAWLRDHAGDANARDNGGDTRRAI